MTALLLSHPLNHHSPLVLDQVALIYLSDRIPQSSNYLTHNTYRTTFHNATYFNPHRARRSSPRHRRFARDHPSPRPLVHLG